MQFKEKVKIETNNKNNNFKENLEKIDCDYETMEKNYLLYFVKIGEKVGEIPADKIDKVVSTKDEKTVNDKSEERLSKLEKNVYGKIE